MASPAEPTAVAAIKVLVLGHDASAARNFRFVAAPKAEFMFDIA
jgi:hypothetical protein